MAHLPRLCIDIDNVLACTDVVMRRLIRSHTQDRVKFDYEHIVEFNYYECKDSSGATITQKEWREVHDLFSRSPDLLDVTVVVDALEALQELSAVFDLHLATARLPTARKATLEWLERNAVPPHALHFLRHGEKHVSLGKFFAVVEDHYEQAADFAKTGTRAYLLTYPWNKGKPPLPNLLWFNNWKAVTSDLLTEARAAPPEASGHLA